MITFSQRLDKVRRDGNLSIADLAHWFERPHPTVSGWLRGGRVGLAPLDTAWIEAQLGRLENMLRKNRGLPVPRLRREDRRIYLDQLRNGRAM